MAIISSQDSKFQIAEMQREKEISAKEENSQRRLQGNLADCYRPFFSMPVYTRFPEQGKV